MKTLATEAIKNLTDEELSQVTGGTMWPNEYSANNYNQFGIHTNFHFFAKHEFNFMGHDITYEQANEIVKLGFDVLSSLNSGYDHKNNVGINENAFLRAFNYHLKLRYGDDWMWNGYKGINYGWIFVGGPM